MNPKLCRCCGEAIIRNRKRIKNPNLCEECEDFIAGSLEELPTPRPPSKKMKESASRSRAASGAPGACCSSCSCSPKAVEGKRHE